MLDEDRWGESVTVVRVYGSTPLEEGDVISAIDGQTIDDWVTSDAAPSRAVGETVTYQILRAQTSALPLEIAIDVPLTRYPVADAVSREPLHTGDDRAPAGRGLVRVLAPLPDRGCVGLPGGRRPRAGGPDLLAPRAGRDRPRRLPRHLAARRRRGGLCRRSRRAAAGDARLRDARGLAAPPSRLLVASLRRTVRGLRRLGRRRRPAAGSRGSPAPGSGDHRRTRAGDHGHGSDRRPGARLPACPRPPGPAGRAAGPAGHRRGPRGPDPSRRRPRPRGRRAPLALAAGGTGGRAGGALLPGRRAAALPPRRDRARRPPDAGPGPGGDDGRRGFRSRRRRRQPRLRHLVRRHARRRLSSPCCCSRWRSRCSGSSGASCTATGSSRAASCPSCGG